MDKKFLISEEKIQQLTNAKGYCIISDKITVDGLPVRWMYREQPDSKEDSGWRFFSGTEDENYIDVTDNFSFIDLNTAANYDQTIIPYLSLKIGSELEKEEGDVFNLFEDLL